MASSDDDAPVVRVELAVQPGPPIGVGDRQLRAAAARPCRLENRRPQIAVVMAAPAIAFSVCSQPVPAVAARVRPERACALRRAGARSARCARSRRACVPPATTDRRSGRRSGSSRRCAGRRGSSRCGRCIRRASPARGYSTPSAAWPSTVSRYFGSRSCCASSRVMADEEVPAEPVVLRRRAHGTRARRSRRAGC